MSVYKPIGALESRERCVKPKVCYRRSRCTCLGKAEHREGSSYACLFSRQDLLEEQILLLNEGPI